MTKENETIDSPNDEQDEVIDAPSEDDDVPALAEKYQKLEAQNKRLFARAKKAEGFEMRDGKWVKPEKAEPVDRPTATELDAGQKALLVAYGIKGRDELELAKSWIKRTGDDIDSLIEDDIFQAKLKGLRDARESANAVPKSNKRSASPQGDELAVAYAKYIDEGVLPEDRVLREKVVEMRAARESTNKMFYNS